MAPPDDPKPGATPVPPRGGKRKPNRPTSSSRPASGARKSTSGGGGAKAANRPSPSDQRRAVLAQQKRKRQTILAIVAVGVVVAVVAVFVGVKLANSGSSTKDSSKISTSSGKSGTSSGNLPVSASVLAEVTGVPTSSLQAAANNFKTGLPDPIKIDGKPITTTGLPEVLYVGAEFCPYCATERWAMVLALSKFGTFSGLTNIHSNSSDVYPNTQTFSFYKSTYTSSYIKFVSVETENVDKQPLQTATAAQSALLDKYNDGNIPFVYFNGKAYVAEVGYNPQVLQGKSFDEIAKQISEGTSTIASNVYATAGALVSNICSLTDGKPGSVCKYFPKALTSSSV